MKENQLKNSYELYQPECIPYIRVCSGDDDIVVEGPPEMDTPSPQLKRRSTHWYRVEGEKQHVSKMYILKPILHLYLDYH